MLKNSPHSLFGAWLFLLIHIRFTPSEGPKNFLSWTIMSDHEKRPSSKVHDMNQFLENLCEVVCPNFHALNSWNYTYWPQVTWDFILGTPSEPAQRVSTLDQLHAQKSPGHCLLAKLLMLGLRGLSVWIAIHVDRGKKAPIHINCKAATHASSLPNYKCSFNFNANGMKNKATRECHHVLPHSFPAQQGR